MKNFFENIKYFLFKYESLITWITCMFLCAFMLGALLSREVNYKLISKQYNSIEIVEKVDTLESFSCSRER